jgi:hypothetical protein
MITNDFCTYAMNFLRQEKILRDHGAEWLASALPALLTELMGSM